MLNLIKDFEFLLLSHKFIKPQIYKHLGCN